MKKAIVLFVVLVVTIAGIWTYRNSRVSFGNWTTDGDKRTTLPWIPFTWMGDSIGNRYFDKLAILVPVSIEGIPARFQCQFDIGSNITMLYGNPVDALSGKFSFLKDKLARRITGKDTTRYLKDLRIKIGNVGFGSPHVKIYGHFGDTPADSLLTGSYKIGTIGVDICKDRVLMIDYPNKNFCVTRELDKQYDISWTPIALDNSGRVILPLEYNGKRYKVLYDCGSSMFALLASHHITAQLTTAAPDDTVSISSWGATLQVVGRPMRDSFTLAGHRFANVTAYSNGGKEEIVPEGYDAVTGNVLFLDKIVVIDFKKKRFGIVK